MNSLEVAGRDDCGEYSKMAPPTIAKLTWDAIPGASVYRVERTTSLEPKPKLVATGLTVARFVEPAPDRGESVTYTIFAGGRMASVRVGSVKAGAPEGGADGPSDKSREFSLKLRKSLGVLWSRKIRRTVVIVKPKLNCIYLKTNVGEKDGYAVILPSSGLSLKTSHPSDRLAKSKSEG